MNRQEAFNQAYMGLKKQGQGGYANGDCVFYSEAKPNVTCAVGQLLTPYWREEFEGRGIGSILCVDSTDERFDILHEGLERCGFPLETEADLSFLGAMQEAHDTNARNFAELLDAFVELAVDYNLEIPTE